MKLLRRFFRAALMALLLCLSFASSCAAGPRFVAGAQWDNRSKPMSWYRPDVQYFVDAGPLSAYVDHVTAAALVDAAATVWNVPGVNFRLGNGGVLDEDVSSDNVYLGASGPVWPADLQSSRYTAKQIAVVFDADGAITDMLLGSGASAPSNCRTNAVTESVDLFIQPGNIAHALIIVNGRCTGSLPEQQLQLRYQLMRTFGRVIGLAWSQLNDNVFTGTPEPTYQQQLHWPIMHPIDVICGSYTYQCLPQPFTLRDDDVAALHLVNSTVLNAQIPGMIVVEGWLWFPDGEGMNGVNVVVHRDYPWTEYHTDSYEDVSSVTGFAAMGDFGNPVTGTAADTAGIAGFPEGFAPGYYLLAGIPPLSQFEFTNVFLSSQPVNPLYVGPYSVGPYRLGTVTQSGSTFSAELGGLRPGTMQSPGRVRIADAASTCNGSADGTEDAPARIAQDGVWVGRLCGVAHVPWTFFAVRAGRTATIDVTSTDESGNATESKAMPLIGLWHASDPTGTLPTLARTATAFNTVNAGTTRLRASFSANESIRMAIADRRGEGRPDFTFLARVLYADAVLPTHMPPGGGALHITGVGFQQGTVVTVGGVLANVVALSSTTIDAVAPSLAALGGNVVNDVAIIDPRTGASSIITGGLTYGAGSGDVLSLVTAPGGSVDVGAPTPFAVRLNDADGKPVAKRRHRVPCRQWLSRIQSLQPSGMYRGDRCHGTSAGAGRPTSRGRNHIARQFGQLVRSGELYGGPGHAGVGLAAPNRVYCRGGRRRFSSCRYDRGRKRGRHLVFVVIPCRSRRFAPRRQHGIHRRRGSSARR